MSINDPETCGGAKKPPGTRTYKDTKSLCNDGVERTAFRIAGEGNSLYVTFNGEVIKKRDIPKTKKAPKSRAATPSPKTKSILEDFKTLSPAFIFFPFMLISKTMSFPK